MDNGRVHHQNLLNPLEFEIDDASLIEAILNTFPNPIKIEEIPHPPIEDID